MKNFGKSRESQEPSGKVDLDAPRYVISVVARMVEMHPQTIRHYERFGFIKPSRTQGKTRLYSQRDVECLARIAHFTRDMGINLAGVEVILKLLDEMEEMRRSMEREIEALRKGLGP